MKLSKMINYKSSFSLIQNLFSVSKSTNVMRYVVANDFILKVDCNLCR